MPVLAHARAAPGRGHHDRLGALLHQRPPRVDQAAHVVEALVLVVQVEAQRAAAARPRRLDERDAEPVEHARRGGVRVGRERRLHAAGERDHPTRVARRGPRARRRDRRRQLARERRGQERPHRHAEPRQESEQPCHGKDRRDRAPHQLRRGRSPDARLDDLAPDVDELPVLDARRAGGLAAAAGEAAIEVQLGPGGDLGPLEHLLDEVDASARPVELVAEQLVGRAGRGAEPAVHALAQDRVRGLAVGRVLDPVGELGLHLRPETSG